jgi:hypothetical protein
VVAGTTCVGVNVGGASSQVEWVEEARKLKDLGYAALTMPDHLADLFAPIPALVSATAATTSLRIGTHVLNHDFRHPGLAAQVQAAMGAAGEIVLVDQGYLGHQPAAVAVVHAMQPESARIGAFHSQSHEHTYQIWNDYPYQHAQPQACLVAGDAG